MKSFLHITCGRFYTIRCAMAAESFRRNGGWFTPEDIANDRPILSRLNTIAFVCTSKRKKEGGGGGEVEKACQVGWEPRHWAVPTALPSPHHHSSLGYKQPLLLLVLLNSNLEKCRSFLFVCLFVCFGCLISGLNTTIFRDVTDM